VTPDDRQGLPFRLLSSLIEGRVSRGFSNVELVYLQEPRNMGKIKDISPEGKYVVQGIYLVRDRRSIFEEFLQRLRPYEPRGHRARLRQDNLHAARHSILSAP